VEDLFIDTARKVARRSGEKAKVVLNDLADHSKKTTSVLRGKAFNAGESAAERLKEAGKQATKASTEAVGKAADVMAEEAKQLGKKSLALAKGAMSGMLKGAKEALKKEEE